MKKFISILKYIFPLGLLLLPSVGFAVGSDSILWDTFKNLSFTPPTSDVSVALLAKLFGTVPGVPQLSTGTTTVLGVVFGVFNAGILALSSVFLGYTVFKVVTETTMDGSSLGSKATIWTAMRAALSTTMLVPQATGYSLINGIVMWVVIQSIGLADQTWAKAMDFLQSGQPAFTPSSNQVDYTLIDSGVPSRNPNIIKDPSLSNVGSDDILRSLVCAYSLKDALHKSQLATIATLEPIKSRDPYQDQELSDAYSSVDKVFKPYAVVPSDKPATCKEKDGAGNYKEECSDGYITFPYIDKEKDTKIDDLSKPPSKITVSPLHQFGLTIKGKIIDSANHDQTIYDNLQDESYLSRGLTGKCGTYKWTFAASAPGGQKDMGLYTKDADNYFPAKSRGAQDMVSAMDDIARTLVNNFKIPDQPDANGKQKPKIDPDIFKFRKDSSGNDQGFFKDPLPPTCGQPGSYTYGPECLYLGLGGNADVSTVQWPIATGEILNGAALYQVAVKPAQMKAVEYSGTSTQQAEQAKIKSGGVDLQGGRRSGDEWSAAVAKGWINAGSYYYLIRAREAKVQMMYDHYRLDDATTVKSATKADQIREDIPYNSLFAFPNPKAKPAPDSSNSIAKDLINFDPAGIDGSYETLNRALKWIYLVAPYSLKFGDELAKTRQGQEGTGFSLEDFSLPGGGSGTFGLQQAQINTQVAGGVMLMLLPGPAAATGIPVLATAPMRYLAIDVNDVIKTWNEQMSSSKDPLLKLQNIGYKMMERSMNFWNQIMGMSVAMSVGTIISQVIGWLFTMAGAPCTFWGTCQGITAGGQAWVAMSAGVQKIAETFIFINLPMGLAITGPLFVNGAILGLYLPLIPYLLFVFGAVSWFISVIVMMAAAPVMCFLMLWGSSSGENPLLGKEAEQFLMQLIAVFFRPTLMIIGLIVGMVLSYIAVDILNLGFKHVIENVIGAGSQSDQLKMVLQAGILVVYTFTMISLVNMCFAPIHMLYSEAMRAAGISGVPAVGMEEKALGEVKAGTGEAAQAGAGGAKEQAGKAGAYHAPAAPSVSQEKIQAGGATRGVIGGKGEDAIGKGWGKG